LEPVIDPSLASEHSKNMLKALTNLDKKAFQESFGGFFFSMYHYDKLTSNEAYYHTLFLAAMFMADALVFTEGFIGDGRYGAKYEAPDGTVFIIEIKYCALYTAIGNNITEQEILEMENLATLTMKQIEEKQYTKDYRFPGAQIYKVALVIAKKADVFVTFKKEEI
jgi:GH43 family beta-xylosidase